MKQLLSLFLFLLPCLAWAQYPSNGNQKITLGEQTTADGLIWRGVAATDTVRKPSIDTMAYMVLDTTTNVMWHYKKATSNAWLRLNLLPSDTASMLTNYYRSGRTGTIQASDVPTLNQNTTGSAATLTTSRTFQTNLASTSTASFNGSANVTPGVTGTLPVANGGTNTTTLTANKVMVGNGTSGVLTPTNLHWDNTNSRLGIGNTNPGFKLDLVELNQQVIAEVAGLNSSTDPNNGGAVMRFKNLSNINGTQQSFTFADSSGNGVVSIQTYNVNVVTHEGAMAFGLRNSSGTYGQRMYITGGGNVGIGTTSPAVQFHTTGDVRFAGLASITDLRTDADGDLYNGSDFNLKNSIDTINFGLKDVLKLKPVQFNWNDINRNLNEYKNLGFIAQDVMDVIPNAASSMGDGDMQVDYNAIVATLTKAIQEQQALIKALEQRIINLENK